MGKFAGSALFKALGWKQAPIDSFNGEPETWLDTGNTLADGLEALDDIIEDADGDKLLWCFCDDDNQYWFKRA